MLIVGCVCILALFTLVLFLDLRRRERPVSLGEQLKRVAHTQSDVRFKLERLRARRLVAEPSDAAVPMLSARRA